MESSLMHLEFLGGEMERLFELEELEELGRDVLGLDRAAVGEASTKAAFARLLVHRCAAEQAVEALCEAMATRKDLQPSLAEVARSGFVEPAELRQGDTFGSYTILEKLGVGRVGTVYRAYDPSGEFRLKVLHPEATTDVRAYRRFATANRMAKRITHDALPWWLNVGEVEGRGFVAHQYADGEPLTERLGREGPLSAGEALRLLHGVFEALAELHTNRVAHGAVHAGNVIVYTAPTGEVTTTLVDLGTDRLRVVSPRTHAQPDRLAALGSLRGMAPEQFRGEVSIRADVYAMGALLYEAITGRPPFGVVPPGAAVAGHLAENPQPLSAVAQRGWVSPSLDELVLALLDKDPNGRPADAHEVLQVLETVPLRMSLTETAMTDEEIDARAQLFLRQPYDDEPANLLEDAIEDGADPSRIAETFALVASQLHPPHEPVVEQRRRDLLARAARIYEKRARDLPAAEQLIQRVLELDPENAEAAKTLERLRRSQGKYEELIEHLLSQSQTVPAGPERAKRLAEIGKIYAKDLDDKAQAVVAYSSAFCEDPANASYARETERLAGESEEAWSEVLANCVEATQGNVAPAAKHALYVQMGKWYTEKVNRPDLGLSVFQAVVQEQPRNTEALEGLAGIYRKAQQWMELGAVLVAHADVATKPAEARDLRAEAGDLLLYRLNDPAQARRLLEQVLSEDPSHERAAKSLAKIYEQTGEVGEYARTLEQRAKSLAGAERFSALCQVARLNEEHLNAPDEAISNYSKVLAEDPTNGEALRGLARCYARMGKHEKLLETLNTHLAVARTPRERVDLLARLGDLHEIEFLDHAKAAECREALLDIEATHDEALSGLARNLRALKRWRDLVVVYERHMEVLTDKWRRVALGLQMGEVFGKYLNVPSRAIESYEAVLKIDPQNAQALDAVAELQAAEGELAQALDAIDRLAAEADSPTARAEQYVRAARLLEKVGDGAGAINRYKMAVDAEPGERSRLRDLRKAYERQGSYEAAVEVLERELKEAEGQAAKGEICGQMARLLLDGLNEDLKAESMARRALDYDPGNLDAILVLGDLAFVEKQYLTASKHFERVLKRVNSMPPEEARRIQSHAVEAFEKSDNAPRALEVAESLLGANPDDLEILRRCADLNFKHGATQRAYDLYRDLWSRFEEALDTEGRAQATFRLGDLARRLGDTKTAQDWLRLAADLDPGSVEPLRSMIQLRESQQRWQDVLELMAQETDLISGDERVDLLIRMGDISASKLHDTNQAARNYLLALADRRDDRKILAKLMQLYSEEKDWRKLSKVILKLAELVDDPKQKAKYLHTAAMVVSRELGDAEQATSILREALSHDPQFEEARRELIRLGRQVGDMDTIKEQLKERIKQAVEGGQPQAALEAMDELSELYLNHFHRHDQAVAIAESAVQLVPDDLARRERLAEIYAADPVSYFEKAVAAQMEILERDAFRPEAYRTLRRIYTDVKRGDSTWCCCQALYALGQANAEEKSFFQRMRSAEPTVAKARIGEEDWETLITHPGAVPLLTVLFTVIQPAVASIRARPVEELGYMPEHRLYPEKEPYIVAQSLHYAAEVLGIAPPPLYQNTNDPGLVSFLHATTPSLVLGNAAFEIVEQSQASAFICARQITYFRPGFYVRHLIATGTELKAWLFATLKLVTPKFRVPADLELQTHAPLQALEEGLTGEGRRYLSQEVVPRLLESGALDLKRWVAAVDLTADRVGLIMCNDLETSSHQVQASGEAAASVPVEQRLEHLFRYAASEPYFALRRLIGTAVDL